MQEVGRPDQQVVRGPRRLRWAGPVQRAAPLRRPLESAAVPGIISIVGEISLLWQDVDAYAGDVLLMSLDTDVPLEMNTFEIRGELALRLKDGVLEEGMRVRVDCRPETIEMVNVDTGETTDEERPVVVDVVVLAQ
jgi:hypothetical protein